jgi:hypothetical protein
MYEFKCRRKWPGLLGATLFFAALAVFLGIDARGQIRAGNGLRAWRSAILCAGAAACAVLGVALLPRALTLKQRVALTQTSLLLPISRWSATEQEIRYDDIQELAPRSVGGYRQLHVSHVGGSAVIEAVWFSVPATFDQICELLAASCARFLPPAP